MFTQISSYDSAIIGDAEQGLSLCGDRLDAASIQSFSPWTVGLISTTHAE